MTEVDLGPESTWPETVEPLIGGDICRGAFHRGERNCSLGWARKQDLPPQFHVVLCNVHEERFGNRKVAANNDNERNTPAVLANAYNEALKRCGYTVEA